MFLPPPGIRTTHCGDFWFTNDTIAHIHVFSHTKLPEDIVLHDPLIWCPSVKTEPCANIQELAKTPKR